MKTRKVCADKNIVLEKNKGYMPSSLGIVGQLVWTGSETKFFVI